MRGRSISERSKNRLCPARTLLLPTSEHRFDFLALKVFLRTTKIAGNNGKLHRSCVIGDVRFAAVSQRANYQVSSIITLQFSRHGLEFAAKKKIQKKCLYDIVSMMSQGNFVRANLLCKSIKHCSHNKVSACPMHMSTHITVDKKYNYMKYMANLFCLYIVDWQCYSVFVNLKGVSVVF